MSPLQRKYGRAIELAEQGGIDSPPEEHGGQLFLLGTVRSPADVGSVWDAIREIPEWESEVVADIRSADFGAAILTFARQPRRAAIRAAAGWPGDSELPMDPLMPAAADLSASVRHPVFSTGIPRK